MTPQEQYGSEVGPYHPDVLVGYGDDSWAFMRPDGWMSARCADIHTLTTLHKVLRFYPPGTKSYIFPLVPQGPRTGRIVSSQPSFQEVPKADRGLTKTSLFAARYGSPSAKLNLLQVLLRDPRVGTSLRAVHSAVDKTDPADEPYFAGIPVMTFFP